MGGEGGRVRMDSKHMQRPLPSCTLISRYCESWADV